MRKAAANRSIVVLSDVDGCMLAELLRELEPRSFNTRSTELALCPIFSGVEPVCFLIVGLSPKKRFGPRLAEEIISP
jgi:hypothetical protein